jgi:hypothetical protein
MSDDDDNTNFTPLSSSTSGSSGTRAWSVSIADDPDNPQPDKQTPNDTEPSESSTAPMNDNEQTYPVTETDELPVTEAETYAGEASQSFAADADEIPNDQPAQYEAPAEYEEMAQFEAIEPDSALSEPYDAPEPAPEFVAANPTGEDDDFAPDEAVTDEAATGFAPDETVTDEAATEIEPDPALKAQTTEELRQAVLDKLALQEDQNEEAFALFERISEDFSTMLATARNDAAVFSFKLMEFAQANAQNNLELARAYSSARSLPEIFTVQADYVKRQMELLNAQARELQALTSEMTAKNAMDIPDRRNAG